MSTPVKMVWSILQEIHNKTLAIRHMISGICLICMITNGKINRARAGARKMRFLRKGDGGSTKGLDDLGGELVKEGLLALFLCSLFKV